MTNYYYYLKNAQGDVVEIYNSSGVCVVKYAYDAYGKCTTVSYTDADILSYNQIKYRGYYYDKCVNLYRLGSRFYDPNTGRFISPDTIDYLDTDSTHGVNLYAYCNDNPINYYDPTGHSITAILICAAIGAAIGFGATVYADYRDDGEVFNGSIGAGAYIGNTLVGGAIGALIGGMASIAPSLLVPANSAMALSYASGGAAGIAISLNGEMVSALGIAGALGLVASIIGKSGGYEISHHYPNDHEPIHVHIKGDDIIKGETRVDINGNVLKGNSPLTHGAKRAFKKLLAKILETLKPWM